MAEPSINRRSLINDLIEHSPGICKNEIIRTTSFSKGTVDYHINWLLKNRTIVEERSGNRTCYYTAGAEPILKGLSRSERMVILSLLFNGASTQADIAKITCLSQPTVSRVIHKLAKDGLVEILVEKPPMRIKPTLRLAAIEPTRFE